MSWFDASSFANLAKNALKEAQKTLDKALDITEEEERKLQSNECFCSKTQYNAVIACSVLQDGSSHSAKKETPPVEEPPGEDSKLSANNTIWDTFANSFFDKPKSPTDSPGKLFFSDTVPYMKLDR